MKERPNRVNAKEELKVTAVGSASPEEKMPFRLLEDLSCPVCRDVFRDPVVLSCSHSFCKSCLLTWWGGKQIQDCPVCKRRSSRSDPPCNLALKNLCKAFLLDCDQRGAAAAASDLDLCNLHFEKLKLFCLDHQQPVCLICRDSKTHSNHRFTPIDEVAQDHRDAFLKSLVPLQEKMKQFEHVKGNCDRVAEHIKLQARHAERLIQEQFKKFREFLREEEEARIGALREEEENKSRKIKEQIEALSRDTEALSDTIRAAEEEIRAEDATFMKNYKAVLKRIQQQPLDLHPGALHPGALIDVAKHLGNLAFSIWYNLKKLVTYTPVILDPNTASPEFSISEDLTSVTHGQKQRLPENPERTDDRRSVWGSEGFASGCHSWDVEVGDSRTWFVGVTEAVQRSDLTKSRFWQVQFHNNNYTTRLSGRPSTFLQVKKRPQRIRVHLDWNRGKLSLSDPDTSTHLHTFTHTFKEKLFPCLGTLDQVPLKVLPGKISVTSERNIGTRGCC